MRVAGNRLNRRGNKAVVSHFFDVAPKTVDDWVRRGCPYLKRGGLNDPWEFDLLEVCQWRYGPPVAAAPITDPDMLPPADRLAWYESEKKRLRLKDRDSELIPADQVRAVTESAVETISTALAGIPQDMASSGIPEHVTALVAAELKRSLASFKDRLENANF